MSRLHVPFACGKCTLAGTLDTAPGCTGLLIVTGGNELRSGAFSGQSQLAARIAKTGFPVFRFDRRGIGDSEGDNRGFRKSAKDIAAALDAFRALEPQLARVIGFGNCDAASALMLAQGAGCDGLILSNPWTIDGEASAGESEDSSPTPSSDAIRARYAEKLKNPRELMRLLRGGVDLRKLAKGVLASMHPAAPATGLAQEMHEGIADFSGPISILLASSDRTAQEFDRHWDATDERIARCKGASHAYVEPHASQWLDEQILAGLRKS